MNTPFKHLPDGYFSPAPFGLQCDSMVTELVAQKSMFMVPITQFAVMAGNGCDDWYTDEHIARTRRQVSIK